MGVSVGHISQIISLAIVSPVINFLLVRGLYLDLSSLMPMSTAALEWGTG